MPASPWNDEGTPTAPDLIDHPEEELQLPIAPQEQESGESYSLRLSIGQTHAHPSDLGGDVICRSYGPVSNTVNPLVSAPGENWATCAG